MKDQSLKNALPGIRKSIDAALAQVAKEHGLQSLSAKGCTYDPTAGSFTFKVEGVTDGGMDKSAAIYSSSHKYMNLPPLGTTFVVRGVTYTISGMNTTGTKVHAKSAQDGKTYLWKVDAIQRICKSVAPVTLPVLQS